MWVLHTIKYGSLFVVATKLNCNVRDAAGERFAPSYKLTKSCFKNSLLYFLRLLMFDIKQYSRIFKCELKIKTDKILRSFVFQIYWFPDLSNIFSHFSLLDRTDELVQNRWLWINHVFFFLNACQPLVCVWQEMTQPWPPLLTAIHTPTYEPPKSQIPAKVKNQSLIIQFFSYFTILTFLLICFLAIQMFSSYYVLTTRFIPKQIWWWVIQFIFIFPSQQEAEQVSSCPEQSE